MPNTLAHMGIQSLATRAVFPWADSKWIYLGCVLPDLPWIGQRVVRALVPSCDPYALRLYGIVQPSLAFGLLLAAALALWSHRPRRTLAVLGLNVALHLGLDACQAKWGNGVVLLAPVDWQPLQIGWFWPEQWPTLVLTALGLVWFLSDWRRHEASDGSMAGTAAAPMAGGRGKRVRIIATLAAVAIYLGAPVLLLGGPLAVDAHFVATLRSGPQRVGRPVQFDRGAYRYDGRGATLVTFAGERLELAGELPQKNGNLSLQGRFERPDRVRVRQWHYHPPGGRELGSLVGLALAAATWWRWLRTRRHPRPRAR